MPKLLVKEIFHSLQGETSHVGRPNIFIRLTGCDLRCTYCDSAYAFQGGESLDVATVIERIKSYPCKDVLITGGEPLLQKATPELVQVLRSHGYSVSIETHGQVDIAPVSETARIVLDVKTPGSEQVSAAGMAMTRQNLRRLKSRDEVKFVLTSMADYAWMKNFLVLNPIPEGVEVLVSPAKIAKDQPGHFEGLSPQILADAILTDGLPVRFQHQLHKWIWGHERTGV